MSNVLSARDDRDAILGLVPFGSAMECLRVEALLRGSHADLSEQECEFVAAHAEECPSCGLLLDTICPDASKGQSFQPEEALHARLERDILERLRQSANDVEPRRVLAMPIPHPLPKVTPAALTGPDENMSQLEGQLATGQILIGDEAHFRIKSRIGYDDFTETYEAEQIDTPENTRAVIKIPRAPIAMSDDAAAERLAVVKALLGVYARELKSAVDLQGVAHVIDTGKYEHRLRTRSTQSTFVAYEFIDGDTLEEYMLKEHPDGEGKFSGVKSAAEFARWARMLTLVVGGMHDRLILHGDICPRNILVKDGKPIFIDVGQAAFRDIMDGAEDFGASFYRAPEALRTPSSDLFSLGGVMYFISTAKKPIGLGTFADIEVLKRHVAMKIKQANPLLFSDDAGVADIVAMCLRQNHRVQHATHLLRDIDSFWPEKQPNSLIAGQASLRETTEMLDRSGVSLFKSIASAKMRELKVMFAHMAEGVFDLSGSSGAIRNAAYSMLGSLRDGDEFLALSLPCFWSQENIGINGRFLSMNRNAARNGARVRRIFLLDEGLSDRHLPEIVAAQLAVANDLEPARRPNYAVRFLLVSNETRRQMLAGGKHFGLLIREGEHVAMFPVYGENDVLVTLRFRSGAPHADGLREIFEMLWPRARPLVDLRLPGAGAARDDVAG